jgi:5-methylcytosine-specific restriction endonuclease McrA
MRKYSRSHLTHPALETRQAASTGTLCVDLAGHLADVAEFRIRKLFVPAGYPSMYRYCIDKLHMSKATAFKRIRVARAAREFPSIFVAIEEGRIHLSGVLMLVPHLTRGNVDELLAVATHKTEPEIERLLAERFPRPDVPVRIEALVTAAEQIPQTTLASRRVESPDSVVDDLIVTAQIAAGLVSSGPIPQQFGLTTAELPRPKVTPLAPNRLSLQSPIDQETSDLLCRAEELLGPIAGAVPRILKNALALYVRHLEKQKCAATERPSRKQPRPSRNPRHIPAAVKRAVRKRDGDRCTFMSDSGHRCESRTQLEFDHVEPVARGGGATVSNIRLRCRAHNQLEAERAFGAGFMNGKRETARESRVRAATEARKYVERITQAAP